MGPLKDTRVGCAVALRRPLEEDLGGRALKVKATKVRVNWAGRPTLDRIFLGSLSFVLFFCPVYLFLCPGGNGCGGLGNCTTTGKAGRGQEQDICKNCRRCSGSGGAAAMALRATCSGLEIKGRTHTHKPIAPPAHPRTEGSLGNISCLSPLVSVRILALYDVALPPADSRATFGCRASAGVAGGVDTRVRATPTNARWKRSQHRGLRWGIRYGEASTQFL